MIHYNVWAMLFRQSHHEHPDRVDLQMPIPNSQPPDQASQAKKTVLSGPFDSQYDHSFCTKEMREITALSLTLYHPLLIYHPNSSSIQSP